MAVFRVERTRDYTVMSNYHLKDTGLTLKAKGLLSMMLSLPDEWNYTTRGLASICKESVETIGKTLRELESAGYLTRRQLRGKNGRITDTEYTIFEKPVKPQPEPAPPDTASPGTENPDMVNPDMETPDMAVPDTENPPQLNTKKSNIQKSNTYGSNTHSFFPSAPAAAETDGQTEVMEKREEIRDQIEYEHICNSLNREQIDEFVEIMLEVALTKKPHQSRSGGSGIPHRFCSAAVCEDHLFPHREGAGRPPRKHHPRLEHQGISDGGAVQCTVLSGQSLHDVGQSRPLRRRLIRAAFSAPRTWGERSFA